MANLGSTIKKFRKQNNMTQKTLAEKICSQSVLSRIESGLEVPNAVVLHQLCERLGISVEKAVSSNVNHISSNKDTLKKMSDHFDNNQYDQLKVFLKQNNCINEFHEDVDLQFYYYCKGSCRYYVDGDYKGALNDLTMALEYTYSPNNHYFTTYEVLILSCLGKVYIDLGAEAEGMNYLHDSLLTINSVSMNEKSYLLTKIFYNIASIHRKKKAYSDARIYLEKGIQFANDLHNSYYLAELFYEKACISYVEGDQKTAYLEMSVAYGIAQGVENKKMVLLTKEKLIKWDFYPVI